MKVVIKIQVLNDQYWPVYENKHEFDNPTPSMETERFKYYQLGFNYVEAKEPIFLAKPKTESEKIPEGKIREKSGEFATKINEDLGILGE